MSATSAGADGQITQDGEIVRCWSMFTEPHDTMSDEYLSDLRSAIGAAQKMLQRRTRAIAAGQTGSLPPHARKISSRFDLYEVPVTDDYRRRLSQVIADFEAEEKVAMDCLGIG